MCLGMSLAMRNAQEDISLGHPSELAQWERTWAGKEGRFESLSLSLLDVWLCTRPQHASQDLSVLTWEMDGLNPIQWGSFIYLTNTQCLLNARHCSVCLTCINSFSHQYNGLITIISQMVKLRSWEVNYIVSSKASIWTWAGWFQSPCTYLQGILLVQVQ